MPHYVPLTADEQSAINKLDEQQEMYVEIEGWGYHPSPDFTYGDKRLQIKFPMRFHKPAFVVPVRKFHLKLKTRSGETLYEEDQPTIVNGEPLQIRAGVEIDLVWDLWIEEISDELTEEILGHDSRLPSRTEVMSVDHSSGGGDAEE